MSTVGMAAAIPAVAVEDVNYCYPGTPAGVTDLSLTIEPGELVVCIGPSGCGKTTLLRLIAGFLRPDRGRIRLNGDDVEFGKLVIGLEGAAEVSGVVRMQTAGHAVERVAETVLAEH